MKNWILIGAVGILVLSSCKKNHFSAGPLETEYRSLTDSISGIEIYGSFDVFVTQSNAYEIKVEAGTNVMPYIDTYVSNNTLIIDEKSNQYIERTRKRVYVSASFLNNIKLKGSGDVQGSNLSATDAFIELDGSGDINLNYISLASMVVDLEGSGDIVLNGTSTDTHIELKGSGNINCKNLFSDEAYVNLEGSGNTKITVFDKLTVNLEGSGNVYYWGNPPIVSTNVTGSGNIVQM